MHGGIRALGRIPKILTRARPVSSPPLSPVSHELPPQTVFMEDEPDDDEVEYHEPQKDERVVAQAA